MQFMEDVGMEEAPTRGWSRKLMGYHCSGSDTVLGDVNVGGSVVILLLIGFVVGLATGWFIMWRRQRKQMLLELEYRDRFAGQSKKDMKDISPLVQSAQVPPVPAPGSSFGVESKLPQTAAALASGPLAMGVRDSGSLPTKQEPLRTSSGNPFAGSGVESYNVMRNPTSSLDNTPSPKGPMGRSMARTSSAAEPAGGSLIPAVLPPAAPAASQSFARRSTLGEQGGTGLGAEPVHARSETMVVVNPLGASVDHTAAARSIAMERKPTSDYDAAVARTGSGNPFVDDKQAQKQELLGQVRGEEYDEGDLDPEWLELLHELDGRMASAGKAGLNSKERAVAIRSLIVATASQSADAALGKAMQDVEVYRRTQAFRGA